MDKIKLVTGEEVEMYCACDGHKWSERKYGEPTIVANSKLPSGYNDACPKCELFKWRYV